MKIEELEREIAELKESGARHDARLKAIIKSKNGQIAAMPNPGNCFKPIAKKGSWDTVM